MAALSSATRRVCAFCLVPLPAPKGGRGRPRRYCDEKCRKGAWLARRSFTFRPATEPGVIPAPPNRERQTVEALIGLVEGGRPTSPEAVLVHLLVESRTLVWQYRKAARDVGTDLGWRAEGVADSIEDALRRHFPTVMESADG